MAKFLFLIVLTRKIILWRFWYESIFKLSPVIVLAALMMKGFDALLAAPLATIYACFIAMIFQKKNSITL